MNQNKPNNHQTLRIPTRDEFHRFASNHLSRADFDTHHPSGGVQINKVIAAISWTYNNERWNRHD